MALCGVDDKRFLLAGGITSLAYGHQDIPTTLKDVEMVGDNALVLGREEADTLGVLIGTARDTSTTLVHRHADAAPGDQSTTGAASSSSTSGVASGGAASATSVSASGAWPLPLISSSNTSRPPNICEKRRKKSVETARELVSQSLWSDDDDGLEGDGHDEDDGIEEEDVRSGRRHRRHPFIDDECGVSKRGREDD